MLSVIRLMSYAKSAGFNVSLSLAGYDALISRARSMLVAAFLDDASSTHLLFVDADISFEPQQVERMLRLDKDFTGALYPLKSIDWNLIPQRCVNGGEDVRQSALSYVGTFCDAAERKQENDFATAIYCLRFGNYFESPASAWRNIVSNDPALAALVGVFLSAAVKAFSAAARW